MNVRINTNSHEKAYTISYKDPLFTSDMHDKGFNPPSRPSRVKTVVKPQIFSPKLQQTIRKAF